jgi:outer membrane protein assembly factor BamB
LFQASKLSLIFKVALVKNFRPLSSPCGIYEENPCYIKDVVMGQRFLVYLESNELRAVDYPTGEARWKFQFALCPVYLDYSDGLIILLSGKMLYAIDELSGETAWSYAFESEQFLNFSSDGGFVFVTLAIGNLFSNTYAFNAKDGTLVWWLNEQQSSPNEIRVFRNFLITDYSYPGTVYSGTSFQNLQTGQKLWSIDTSRIESETFLYVDDQFVYTVVYSSSFGLMSMKQRRLNSGEEVVMCTFQMNPPALFERYASSESTIGYAIREPKSDGLWVYVYVGDDLHRFPLCGKTPAFPQAKSELVNGLQRYELPSLLFTKRYFSCSYASLDLEWIAGPYKDTFLFQDKESSRLFGTDNVPKNYIFVNEDGKLDTSVVTEDVNRKVDEYTGVSARISRLDIIGDLVFVGTIDGIFHVFDLHTQEVIFRTRVNSPNFAPFHLVDDIVIVETLNGEVMAFKLDLPKIKIE